MTVPQQALYQHDLRQTLENRKRLRENINLLYWYEQLYRQIFSRFPDIENRRVLEIGSGTSPLSLFYPSVSTSDVLELDYLDHVFDCHEIDRYDALPDHSVDIITLTNVLHHLRAPVDFLTKARRKLKAGGKVIAVEPYFSALSYPLYKLLHHEPVNFSAKSPGLEHIEGPLSSSNQAVPYMLFISRPDWLAALEPMYDVSKLKLSYFSSLSYMATGGISRTFRIPASLYRPFFAVDLFAASVMPKLFASFFITELTARDER